MARLLKDEQLEAVEQELSGTEVGVTRVLKVKLKQHDDQFGEPALFVSLVLDYPPEGLETWPRDDIKSLRHLVWEVVMRQLDGGPGIWYVSFDIEDEALVYAD